MNTRGCPGAGSDVPSVQRVIGEYRHDKHSFGLGLYRIDSFSVVGKKGRVQCGRVHFGKVQFGKVQFGRVQFGRVQFGCVQFGCVQFGRCNLKFGRVRHPCSETPCEGGSDAEER